jgi:TonB family protein
MKICALLVAVVSLWLPYLSASDDTAKKQEAIKRIEQAVSNTNIFELPSFQMKASVQIETQGKLVDGSYQLLWNGPNQWREEVSFPGYAEVQVGGKGIVWIQRSTDFYPLQIYNLHAALGFGSGVARKGADPSGSLVQSSFSDKYKVEKIRERKKGGDRLTCVEYENELKGSSEICVDDNANALVRGSSYVDKDFQPVGGKTYPRSLSFVEEGSSLARVHITEISTPAKFPAGSFSPPAGVQSQTGCMNPAPFRLVKKIAPAYPQNATHERTQGVVSLDVRVGADGIPKIDKAASRVDPNLERSAMAGVKEWRYEPATCAGTPVEVETVVQVSYTISR